MNCDNKPELLLNNKPLEYSNCEPHLGIYRNPENSNTDTINSRIKSARRATFELLDTGFHGWNGTGPEVAVAKFTSFLQPILTYGLEAVVMTKADFNMLATYQREVLRCIMHMPKSTAIPAIYFLLGLLPVEGRIHIQVLSLLRSVLAADSGNPPALFMKELMCRRLATKDSTSSSWAAYTKLILKK